jgi:two-component system LytT family sensor kinase
LFRRDFAFGPRLKNFLARNLRQAPWRIWAISFPLIALIALIVSTASYNSIDPLKSSGFHYRFLPILGNVFISFSYVAVLAPYVLAFARKFPIGRESWKRNLPLHVIAAVIFTAGHAAWMILLEQPQNPKDIMPATLKYWSTLTLWALNQDAFDTYGTLVAIAHVWMYYERVRDREIKTSQLESQLARTQLEMLKLQLQPHFLFNTLNAISALMHQNVYAAQDMLSRLSDLLRLSLDNVAVQEVTLKSEVEFVRGYLHIEQVRFQDRLSVNINIDPETLDAMVPNMLLQPLVENSIRHGIARKSGPGSISIESQRSNGSIRITIRDNGPGFPTVTHKNGNGNGNGRPKGGLGLGNTRARLRQMYGDAHRLEVGNAPEGGAVITLEVPERLWQEEPESIEEIRSA